MCRAKQGKAQSVHDQQSRAKSAGAQIRRENEKALMEKIQAQIGAWAEPLSKCRRNKEVQNSDTLDIHFIP